MDAMKRKSASLILLVALLLPVDTHSAERQRVFHSEANGYSVTIPEGWKQVPDEVFEEMFKAVLTEEGRTISNFEALFAVKWSDNQVESPYLVIQVIKYSDYLGKQQLAQNEIAYFLKAVTGLDMNNAAQEARKNMSDDAKSRMSDVSAGRVSFDEKRMVYRYGAQAEIAGVGKAKSVTVGHIGKYATVHLIFFCLELDWFRFENERNLMSDSFLFDQGMRYQDAPSKGSRIFDQGMGYQGVPSEGSNISEQGAGHQEVPSTGSRMADDLGRGGVTGLMLFWTLTIGLLLCAVAFCIAGRLVRQYAYHAGRGFGLGAPNVPRLFRKIPWPMVWLFGGVLSIVSTVFVVLAVGVGSEIRFIMLVALAFIFGRFLGDLIFYRLFRNTMERAYWEVDRSERVVQTRVKELLKEYHEANPKKLKGEQEE